MNIIRYSTGKQPEADETVHLIFLPIKVVETWNFNEADESSTNALTCNFNKLYSEMTWGCQGGMRLLHLHFQKSNEHN